MTQQAQSREAEDGMEDIDHVAWPISYTALQ